ncbi:DUF2924 domain-containing protein [Roseiconus nitratireducens]|uniref:DUF2924 domain-containing protein n=1 Tax=Roseiconus nitratireducens TaxID=2605748 RepID=A0A5M6D3M8_9BACT|nr:DUF2924 domain-containing protein [Roseiconus nitratireducens]KAA5541486.1 DUF2924 domain-containing protein [Roseiconus nitratireducens]
MSPKVAAEVARLPDMTVNELIHRYEQVYNEETRSRNKQYLIRRIAWKLQANEEGGLSEQTIGQAIGLAADAQTRVTAPRENPNVQTARQQPNAFIDWDPRLPPPGQMLERQYKGQMIRVAVLREGFEYEGQRFRSLTAVAKAVTGSHCNGFLFFRLGRREA